jgi:uncharacterized membrane protein (GlpM family)
MSAENQTIAGNAPPAWKSSTLIRWLPTLLLIALGFYLHYTHRSDGIIGILAGLALIAHVLVSTRRSVDSLSPVGRFVARWKGILMVLGVFAVVGGALDAAGLW